jgi:hypothetical protein
MNSYLKRLSTVVVSFILGIFLSGCTESPQPQNTNSRAQSNQSANATPAGTQPNVPGAPQGYLDAVHGEAKTGESITVIGWAADVEDGAPAKRVDVLLDNNVVAQATLGKERGDVAKVTGRPDWQRAGWEAAVSLANVSPGLHKIMAVAYDSTGTKGALNGARDIEVAAK